MKNTRRASAFSLIEISIVILIIGILVAGVTQSSRLLSTAKLSGARSMTQSAPVASIKDLALWIEATSETSFSSADLDDATAITTWNDINPQTISKVVFSGGTSPTYNTNRINGLPAVTFNGSSQFLTSTNFSNIGSNAATVFIVARTPSTIGVTPTSIFSKRVSAGNTGTNIEINLGTTVIGTKGWQFCNTVAVAHNCYSSGHTIATNSNYVMQMTYTSGSATGADFFQDGLGGTQGDTTTGSLASVADAAFLGKSGLTATPAYFSGQLGELIIFDRLLKLEERRAIEAYLGKKWGIAVAQ
ncbi:MAG: prepilin-type N-terminal cleavage/methylation domain-containing protein [Rickettsiales bacterium]|nr:prepilin-type N-terminal cleavage/methylation domain-containing protein [Rickettsiales bacterium]